jgi:S-adenosylmethionine-diacylglycerol 3-amino-3-carboxypropyl transferase
VVREDPEIEVEILSLAKDPKEALLIGSGGCSAFTMRNRFPDTLFTLLEPNPAQVDLIRKKEIALQKENLRTEFGVETDDPASLTNCGNFESLFRCLRQFIYEFVMPKEDWITVFDNPQLKNGFLDKTITNPYWSVAFELFFSDSILVAMFGSMAVQHAPKGSYPSYFRKVLESGLKNENAASNYFLHHIFLGHYRSHCTPKYLTEELVGKKFQFLETSAENVNTYKSYDLVSLSNIFDWMEVDQVAKVAMSISKDMKAGAYIVYRQLNNETDFRKFFDSKIKFDDRLSKKLHFQDRSLFYSSLHVGRKEE